MNTYGEYVTPVHLAWYLELHWGHHTMSFFASVCRSRSNCSMEFGSRVLEEKKGTPHELQHPSGPIIRGTVIGEAAAVVVAVGGAVLLSTPLLLLLPL
jgi:hypothetical protein